MAQWVKCSQCNCEVPSSVPRTHVKMLGVAGYVCNPTAGLAEIGGSLGSLDHQPRIHGEFQASEKTCLQKNEEDEA